MAILLKRSPGISVIGWMMIILASFQLAFHFSQDEMQIYPSLYPPPVGRIFYFLIIGFLLAEMFIGINILSLKEWARKSVYVLVCLYLGLTLVGSMSVEKNYLHYLGKSYKEFKQIERKIKFRLQHIKETYQVAQSPLERERISGEYTKQVRVFAWYQFWTDFMLGFRIFVLVIKFILWYIIAVLFFARPKIRMQFQ